MEIELIKTLIKNKRAKEYGPIASDVKAKLYDEIKKWSGRGSIPKVQFISDNRATVTQVANILTKEGYAVYLANPPEHCWVTIREDD